MQNRVLITITILLAIGVAGVSGFLVFKDKELPFTKKTVGSVSASVSKTVSKVFDVKKPINTKSYVQAPGPEEPEEKTKTDNLTDALSALIAEQAIATGLNLEQDPRALEQAFAEQFGQAENLFSIPETPDGEINISSDNSTSAQKEYTKTLSELLSKYFPASIFQKSDIEIAYDAVQEKNFEQLDKYIKAYQILYDKIKKVPTPPDWLEIHKEQLGLFSVTEQLLQAYRNIDKDPLKASIAAEKYPEILKQAYELAIKIEDKMALLK